MNSSYSKDKLPVWKINLQLPRKSFSYISKMKIISEVHLNESELEWIKNVLIKTNIITQIYSNESEYNQNLIESRACESKQML